MNAREALDYLDARVHTDASTLDAITTLSAALDERDTLLATCEAIIREGDPHTATQDWPDPASFADWAIEQARAAIAKEKATTEDATARGVTRGEKYRE